MSNTRLLLRALTPEAENALGGRVEVSIDTFPYRVGRESRVPDADYERTERRLRDRLPNNDLYLFDDGVLKHVSREHFLIERDGDGSLWIRDCGSACGTMVGSHHLGHDHLGKGGSARCRVEDENVVIVGGPDSPFVYQVLLMPQTDEDECAPGYVRAGHDLDAVDAGLRLDL